MRRFLLAALPLLVLPATAEAQRCAQVLVVAAPFQEASTAAQAGPGSFDWKVSVRNITPTRQVMRIWLQGVANVADPVDAGRRHSIPPFGSITITLGRISGAQPSVAQMAAAIQTFCEG